jgi:hypothetical protein
LILFVYSEHRESAIDGRRSAIAAQLNQPGTGAVGAIF